MINFLFSTLFLLILFTFSSNKDEKFIFLRTILSISNESKRILIHQNGTDLIKTLYYQKEENNKEGYCSNNDTNVFICEVNESGIYSFKYEDQITNTNNTINQKVFIFKSFEDIFNLKIKDCLYIKEDLNYTLEYTKEDYVEINDLSNIKFMLNSSQEEYFEKKENNYIFQIERTPTNYILYLVENDDFEDPILKKEIIFTDIELKNYFYPDSKFIYMNTSCKLDDPDKLIFNSVNSNQSYEIQCNDLTNRGENIYKCDFLIENQIIFYGYSNIIYKNKILKENFFSSKRINESNFNIIANETENNFRKVINISITSDEYYMDAIDSLTISPGGKITKLDGLYISDDLSTLIYLFPFDFGNSYKLASIEGETLFDEKEINLIKELDLSIKNHTLDHITFEPNYTIVGYFNSKYYYTETQLIYKKKNPDLFNGCFCNNKENNYNLKSTLQFECVKDLSNEEYYNYSIISPINEPGIIETNLDKYYDTAKLTVIRYDIDNVCQDIYGYTELLDNIFIKLYIPKYTSNLLKVYYNEKLQEKEKLEIEENENYLDYTVSLYIIPNNSIYESGEIIINYNNTNVANISVGYTNTKLPTLINNYFKIVDYIEEIEIKFSEKINNIEEIKNSFFLWNGNAGSFKEDNCIFQNDNLTIICPNKNEKEESKYLYFRNKCDYLIKLDYYLHYSPQITEISIHKYYYILPENNESIILNLIYYNSYNIFPLKVYINNDEMNNSEYLEGEKKMNYSFSTNKEGLYKITYLTQDLEYKEYDKNIIIKNDITGFFSEIKPDEKCVYYKNKIKYKIKKNDGINETYIKYKFFKSSETPSEEVNNLTCNDNDCSIDLSVENSGEYKIIFYSLEEFEEPYLYEDTLFFTDISSNLYSYSNNIIILNSICLLENLSIKNKNNSINNSLKCEDLSKSQVLCRIQKENDDEILSGLYNIYENNQIVSKTYFNLPIEESEFLIQPLESKIGKNEIKITSNDINLESIVRIEIRSNDGNTLYYKLNDKKYNYDLIDDYISLTFIGFPQKVYSLQLYNEIGGSKSYEFKKKEENIEINFDKVFFVHKKNTPIIISITGDYVNQIEYIYYRKEYNDFSYQSRISGTYKNNRKTFNFYPENPNKVEYYIYYFGFSLFNESTIFNILNKKVIIGNNENIFSFVMLLPFYHIFNTNNVDFVIDIIPTEIVFKVSYNIKVYIGDIINQPIITFQKKKLDYQ